MPAKASILIASTAPAERTRLLEWLSQADYVARAVAGFAAAKHHLDLERPDLLVTGVKLGEYNGLHLVVRGHLHNPRLRVIVVGDPDAVLERDAEREGAVYIAYPFDRTQLLDCVARVLATRPSARRSPRKQIQPLDAFVGSRRAEILDVGYAGFRLEVNAGPPLPEHFVVHIPQWGAHVLSRRLWTKPVPDIGGQTFWYGALVDDAALPEWRGIVDATPGSPVPADQ